MMSLTLNFKVVTILLISLFFTTLSSGQDRILESNKYEWCFIKNPMAAIRKSPFKFTVTDSWFSRDKAHHFLTSTFLSGAGYYFFREEQNFSHLKSQQGGFCFSISLGLIKEIRDGFKPGNAFSVKDLVVDILGTVVGIALVGD